MNACPLTVHLTSRFSQISEVGGWRDKALIVRIIQTFCPIQANKTGCQLYLYAYHTQIITVNRPPLSSLCNITKCCLLEVHAALQLHLRVVFARTIMTTFLQHDQMLSTKYRGA